MMSARLLRSRRPGRLVAAFVVVALTACTGGPSDRASGEFGPPTATPPKRATETNAGDPLPQQLEAPANGQSGAADAQQGGQSQIMATATTSARFGAVFNCLDPNTQCRQLLAEQQAGPLRLRLVGSEVSPDTLVVVVINEGAGDADAVGVSVLVELVSVAFDGGVASPAPNSDAPQSTSVTIADVVGGVSTDRGTCAGSAIDGRPMELRCQLGNLEPGASGTVTVDYGFVPQTTVVSQVALSATVDTS